MKRIGITVNIRGNLFSNGINQNALYLARVLKEAGYIVDLICGDEKTLKEVLTYEKEVNSFILEKSYNIRYNLIIQLGFTVEKSHFNKWKLKNDNLKMVAYQCGNHFLNNMERILFKKTDPSETFKRKFELDQKPNQVWSIPQMEDSNYDIYQFMHKQEKVTVVPFIWDPFVIEETFNLNGGGVYEPREINRCSVMEPNISVMKNVVFPTIVLEKNQKINPFKEIYLFGANTLNDSKPFVDFIKSTEIYNKNILSIESRYPTAKVLCKHVDLVFSWQWENNLNYLWLDVAWMGYPIIHNGSLCKDVGYYYEGFNGDQAICKITEVLSKHNQNHKEYLDKNRTSIIRYTKENKQLINQYKELVDNVLNNKFERKQYNWETNEIY